MATKTLVRADYNKAAIKGIATLKENQINSLTRGSQRLRSDLTYVVPVQMVHLEDVDVNGTTRPSAKVFVIGVNDKGQAILVDTLSVNGLSARHYGPISNGELKVKAVLNDAGLWRAERATQQSVFVNGKLPVTVKGDKTAYISRPFAFKVVGRQDCYQAQFTETAAGSGKWNINHTSKDGQEYVDFGVAPMNSYDEVLEVPGVDAAACIEGFDAYTVRE